MALGYVQDKVLASWYGVTTTRVSGIRSSMSIPRCKVKVGWRKITPTSEQESVLKDRTLRVVDCSNITGFSVSWIENYRKENKVGRYKPIVKEESKIE